MIDGGTMALAAFLMVSSLTALAFGQRQASPPLRAPAGPAGPGQGRSEPVRRVANGPVGAAQNGEAAGSQERGGANTPANASGPCRPLQAAGHAPLSGHQSTVDDGPCHPWPDGRHRGPVAVCVCRHVRLLPGHDRHDRPQFLVGQPQDVPANAFRRPPSTPWMCW